LQRWLPLVKPAWEEWSVRPSREPEHFAEPEQAYQETAELSIEGPDRRRPRPKNKATQTLHSRGKHKAQSDQPVVVVNAKTKGVGYVRQTSAGKLHEKKLVDTEPSCSPPDTRL
jgi:hypothetical protein